MNRKFSFLFSAGILLALFIRLYALTSAPPALHGDELGIGYNAYTLLKTGKDEYGRFLPLTFRSDFTPVIFYATVPIIGFLGLTEFATRFPTALIGVLTVPAVYLLVFELTQRKKLALLVMCLVTLSSWHIRTSRIALELTWGLFFQIVAVTVFLIGLRKGRRYLMLSFVVFAVSIFSYHATKMTTPLLLLALLFIYRAQILSLVSKKNLTLLFILFIVSPIGLYFLIQDFSRVRFVGISVFTLWKNSYSKTTSLFSFKPLADLSIMILKNYLVHFDPRLLFLDNQKLRYFQLSNLGLFYLWQSPFIVLGFIQLLRNWKSKSAKLLIFWFFLAPLPAALTTGVPFSNIGRVILLLPVMECFSAQGIITLGKNFGIRFLTISISSLSFWYFIVQYFFVTPITTDAFWGVQWRDAARIASEYESRVDQIIFTNPQHQSYMYVLFYGHKKPDWVISQEKKRAADIGYSKIGKYEFRPIDWKRDSLSPRTLIVGTTDEIPHISSTSGLDLLLENNAVRIVKTP